MEVVRYGQAGHACPAVSDFEQLKGINETKNLLLGIPLFEDNGEHTGGAGKVAFPEFVSWARWDRWMQHQFNLGTFCQPQRQLKSTGFNCL